MGLVEPLPGEPAAVANLDDEQALVVADYHAGFEAGLRYEGVEIESRAEDRYDHVFRLLDRTTADRVIFLGDLAHWIGAPAGAELDELIRLLEAIERRVPVTLVKGNHDGKVEDSLPVPVSSAHGIRIGDVGFAHGHTWPSSDVLSSRVICVGHEHPNVRLEDPVGGRRIERVWLRGLINPEAFEADTRAQIQSEAELIVFPAFNDLVGGTWINVEEQEFLAPFLPSGLANGDVYLLDGTRLGDYQVI